MRSQTTIKLYDYGLGALNDLVASAQLKVAADGWVIAACLDPSRGCDTPRPFAEASSAFAEGMRGAPANGDGL